jgi:hypothetical protein
MKKKRKRWSVLKIETPATIVEEFCGGKIPVGCTPNVLGKFLKKCSECTFKFLSLLTDVLSNA